MEGTRAPGVVRKTGRAAKAKWGSDGVRGIRPKGGQKKTGVVGTKKQGRRRCEDQRVVRNSERMYMVALTRRGEVIRRVREKFQSIRQNFKLVKSQSWGEEKMKRVLKNLGAKKTKS